MKPSFLEGAGLAAGVSLGGSLIYHLFRPIYGSDAVLQCLATLIGFGYVLYLLGRTQLRGGRVTILACWSLGAGLIAWLSPSLPVSVCGHLALVWLVRAASYHAGLLPALADLCLSGFSLLAAAWAVSQTHSVGASLWCLMLVQAMFSLIPGTSRTVGTRSPHSDEEPFESACRQAEAALRALSNSR